ncbi:PREDICTED: putative disease resistance protein RGA3 [Nicotiana attenuata]|uniref:putative disease resistance protein RGA3 n=1 Tax=Nicotiana attenuata TaxID=49451 RepID=UPI0009057A42|nr:PREDICTED: putative disease resistance protein RGA3 [Nicotiana attenuata]
MKWDDLKKLLMVGACGSKILVTTRNAAIASIMGTVPAYNLKGLLSEDCLTLFLRMAFEQGQEVLYPNLVRIASDIMQKCEGPMSTMFVENCIARFAQLRVLDLKELPDSINKLLSLQTLRLSHCALLEGLPKDIGNLISLRHLHITTKQTCFPDKAIGCLSSLRSLYIHSCTNLVSLSEGLQYFTSFRTLAIIGCPRLTFFPSIMKHLTALENLMIVDFEELTLLEWKDIEGLSGHWLLEAYPNGSQKMFNASGALRC